jgi:PP-loop superfamily ATP-utilizing enzyme
MRRASPLADLLGSFPSILVGYSGGVDSALLAVVARQVLGKERAAAAIGRSAS